jgi:hypothetical protein
MSVDREPSALMKAMVSIPVVLVCAAVPILIELGLISLGVTIPEWTIAPAFILISVSVYLIFKLSPIGRYVWNFPPYGGGL